MTQCSPPSFNSCSEYILTNNGVNLEGWSNTPAISFSGGYNYISVDPVVFFKNNVLTLYRSFSIYVDNSGLAPTSDALYTYSNMQYSNVRRLSGVADTNWRFMMNLIMDYGTTKISKAYSAPGCFNLSVTIINGYNGNNQYISLAITKSALVCVISNETTTTTTTTTVGTTTGNPTTTTTASFQLTQISNLIYLMTQHGIDVTNCLSNCSGGNGICVYNSPLNRLDCACDPLYYGSSCQHYFNPCFYFPCLNGGSCFMMGITEYECKCRRGFYGKNCEILANLCANKTCTGNGKCNYVPKSNYNASDPNEMSFSTKCSCYNNYYGDECEHEDSNLKALKTTIRAFSVIAIVIIIAFYSLFLFLDVTKQCCKVKKKSATIQSKKYIKIQYTYKN